MDPVFCAMSLVVCAFSVAANAVPKQKRASWLRARAPIPACPCVCAAVRLRAGLLQPKRGGGRRGVERAARAHRERAAGAADARARTCGLRGHA
eukprot:4090432-Pleurochrysis_carterae.AAC.1